MKKYFCNKKIYIIITFILFMFIFSVVNIQAEDTLYGQFISNHGNVTWEPYFTDSFTTKDLNIGGKNIQADAFCCHQNKAAPPSDTYFTAEIKKPGDPDYNKGFASVLYYGYGGPGFTRARNSENYIITWQACSYVFSGQVGNSIQNKEFFKELLGHYQNQDCPDGMAYVVLTPDNGNIQTIMAFVGEVNGNAKIRKTLQATDYDSQILLDGASFKATSKTNPSQQYNFSAEGNGIYSLNNVPTGIYTVEEVVTPTSALKVANFDIEVKAGDTAPTPMDIEDKSKKIRIAIDKSVSNNLAGKTDATLAGAYFTVYTDASCTTPYKDKNGTTVVIGPTNESGYAISGTMRTGTYYLKETTFPVGMNPDAIISGTNETYRNKVYSVNANNASQTAEIETISVILEDKPINGHLKIYKTLQESDYDETIPLAGAQFTVKLKSAIGTANEQATTYLTNISGEDGICKLRNLPYGTYVVEETTVPVSALKVDNFEFSVTVDDKTYVYGNEKGTIQECADGEKFIDISKKMKIVVRKQDYDADIYGKNKAGSYNWTQGDATFVGAQYTIYRDRELTDVVDIITIDHQNADGYWCAESKYMWTGTYYVKETKRPEGYLIDENVYTFSQDPATQVEEKITIERALENGGRSTEKVERGRVETVKFDQNSDIDEKYPATGAKLWLVLNSSVPGGVEGKSSSEIAKLDGLTYYEEIVNKDGYADFIDKIYRAEYPEDEYTIPYGTYTIIEIAGSEEGAKTHFFSKPQEVKVTRQSENKYYILGEEQIRMYLQIQKMDADINKEVHIEGAVFKVWDVKRDKFVTQKYTPDGQDVEEFVTNANGKVTLPEKLDAGEYIIYEIKAPDGYYSNEEYRLPENESDVGVIGKGGKHVVIDKESMGIEPDSTGKEVDLYYRAEVANTPLKGKLQIVKTGEQFSGTTQVTQEYGKSYEVTKPKFENKGLKGVTYEIIAAEKIMTPDGENQYIDKGKVVATITTDENGIAETEELYLGEYEIKEIVTPNGYMTDNDIPNVVLENEGPEEVKTTVKELSNVRQKLSVMIDKVFEDVKYSSSQEMKKEAVFGIYANQNFTYSNGNLAIAKDTLVATIKVVEGVAQDTDSIDLPEGEYYVKELEASYPYTILDEIKYVTLKYEPNGKEKLTFGAGEFINVPETATVTLIKLSTSTLEDVVLNGDEIDASKLDEEVQALLKELSGKSTEEVRAYLQEKQVKFVAGAKYGVYMDEDCTEPLYMENDEGQLVQAIMETDDSGLITMGEVPLGTYYFKEIEAPKGYELSKDSVKLNLTLENKDAVVYQALIEEPVVGKFITKTDVFTGEVVPKCVFEVRDEDDNVLLHDKTDNKGIAYIPVDMLKEGETYQFVEIEAPEIYDLNTEPHEFTAHFDENGNWDVEPIEVENIRKKSEVTFEKSDFADSTPIPNCKFELRSLETDFVVEGVTDEEGKYVFKDIPYGKYTYKELEAPEEYMIDTEETTLKITNTKKPELPDTGDIAVYTLSVVALVSVLGIVYVIKRNKRLD